MTARNTFDRELELLNIYLIQMGSLAEEAIENAIKAFKNHDNELAKIVINSDNKVDDMEKLIEAKCLSLILRQQPVARDLRKISTALKMITDIERVGDHAVDIAKLSMEIEGEHIYSIVKHIPIMAEASARMVHDATTAFVNSDLELVNRVMEAENEIDALFFMVKADIASILKEGKDTENNAIDFLMIAKYLERIADHAVNICEWVIFSQTGEHKNMKLI